MTAMCLQMLLSGCCTSREILWIDIFLRVSIDAGSGKRQDEYNRE
ncbi:hypothetical protein DZ08F97_52630 [Escherichia coli]|nr:hypothetical protein [Escherichia coli]